MNAKIVAVVALLYAADACAKLPRLDFWNPRHPFTITAPGNPGLAKLVREQLQQERKANPQLLDADETLSLAQHELTLVEKILRAQGYFRGEVSLKSPTTLEYQIETGPRFLIDELILELPDTDAPLPALDISQGEPLVADVVLDTLEQIKTHYSKHACFYPLEVKYQATIDKAAATAQLRIYLTPYTSARFGSSEFHGAPSIDNEFLQYFLSYEPGDCYKQNLLDKTRLNLLKSDLLTSTDVQTRLEGDEVVTDIHLTPRKPRTIKGGLSYDGDSKEGLSLDWENRNLWGGGEHLSFSAAQNRILGDYQARLTLPHVYHPQQNLIISTEYKTEDSTSSQSSTEIVSASLERHLSEYSVVSLGVETEFIHEKNVRDSGLLAVPLRISLNNTDQLLNPTRGWALTLGANSVWDAYHPEIQFQQQNIAGSIYYTYASKSVTPTLALRAASGSISGESLDAIPVTKRFFVGGGGSVRGYPYKSLGAMTDGKPNGGLSFAEGSAELRLRWGESWGVAAFYDGGWAYADDNWHWGKQFLWGYGVGVRYYTLFAPIRLDIAWPKTRREGIDDPYQIYVSLGQAF
ncbi:MAG TPA: BamA/TamA family outer membrane protein [Cellvibrionaceae bacterium]